jgi:SAM-dependent methyltransferase
MENLYRNTAWLYDVDNRDNLHDDIPFYIHYAKSLGGEVLELGCGTGRVSLALAKAGISVTGLDLSEDMLEIFHRKLDSQPALKNKIQIVNGNMANFRFDNKFSLIIAPFRAFQALTEPTDIENALLCIKSHLTENGVFIVNVFKPNGVLDESWCYEEKTQWERFDEASGYHVTKKHWGDKIDTVNQVIYPHYAYYITEKSGETKRITDDLALKYYYEQQLENVVVDAGFVIQEKFGWYDKRSIGEANRELIFVCGRSEIYAPHQ